MMAQFDYGDGCACGLKKECDCTPQYPVKGQLPIKGTVRKTLHKTENNSVIDNISSIFNSKSSNTDDIMYKYAEGQIIADFKAYIDSTYNQHYSDGETGLQAFDAWIELGDATPTFRNTALKYLWRYGKKNGNNKADLFKTLHYTLLCLYNDHYKKGE